MRDILQRAPVRMLTPATRICGIVLRVRNPIQVVTINGGARTFDSSSSSSSRQIEKCCAEADVLQ